MEYYLPGNGLISVAAFHRWVDNVFYQNAQVVGSTVFNSGGVDRSGYLLTSTFNGQNGRLYGVELSYQQQFTFLPGFWRGSWRDVVKDMKGRYPKHRWPDQPWLEKPSMKTKNAFNRSDS